MSKLEFHDRGEATVKTRRHTQPFPPMKCNQKKLKSCVFKLHTGISRFHFTRLAQTTGRVLSPKWLTVFLTILNETMFVLLLPSSPPRVLLLSSNTDKHSAIRHSVSNTVPLPWGKVASKQLLTPASMLTLLHD